MILCITEKPSVGKDIAQILGATVRRDGYFEGNGYCVTWTFGHLCCLKDPSDYTEHWKKWSLSSLPMIPNRFGIKLIDNQTYKKQFDIISNLISQCEEIINCGDAGQEGELIQRWVMSKSGNKKPVKRLWINSLTDDAIREGFRNLRPEKDLEPLYMAGLCRAIGDWVLGINATRLYSLKYGGKGEVLSVGRVQTPTLAIVVNRQLEIENFVPSDFWELKTRYRNVVFSAKCKSFDNKTKAQEAVNKIKNTIFTITDIVEKKGKEAPPRLFDLTSLQVECNKKLNLGADETLKTIQSLYEKKLTTYPRVDTTYLPDDIYPKCKDIMNSLREFHHLMGPIKGKALKKSKKVFDNSKITDHHAIIPTGERLPENLSQKEKDVFRIIALRFISSFFPDCSFMQTTVNGKAGEMPFKATGKTIIDQGWRYVYASKKENEADNDAETEDTDNAILPSFTAGETGSHEPFFVKKTTQPPKYYTEGTLLKAMETAGAQVEDEDLREALKANGIGRPSTRASIIEILYRRGYIVKERKSIKATPAALELIALIKDDLLKSPKLTGIWEGRLRAIENGDYEAAEFISQIKQMVVQITGQVMQDTSQHHIETNQSSLKTKNSKKTKKKSGNDSK